MQNPYKVMIVDDSSVVRGLMSLAISEDSEIEIISTAHNGEVAIKNAARHSPEVIILDIEMPIMNGIDALKILVKQNPDAKIIMASTLTVKNAEISMEAMKIGAVDYLTKPTARSGDESLKIFHHDLIAKIKALGGAARRKTSLLPKTTTLQNKISKNVTATGLIPTIKPCAIAVGSSTGGPDALIKLFTSLKGRKLDIPIFITQHMPPTFTKLFAGHLSKASGRKCMEAAENEVVQSDVVYIAPGDYHMIINRDGANLVTNIIQTAQENYCRPSVDPMLRSLIKLYKRDLLMVMLTGMGHDGLQASRELKAAGGTLIAQDKETSVVWGMPGAVAEDGICNEILPLDGIAHYIIKACGGNHHG